MFSSHHMIHVRSMNTCSVLHAPLCCFWRCRCCVDGVLESVLVYNTFCTFCAHASRRPVSPVTCSAGWSGSRWNTEKLLVGAINFSTADLFGQTWWCLPALSWLCWYHTHTQLTQCLDVHTALQAAAAAVSSKYRWYHNNSIVLRTYEYCCRLYTSYLSL